MKATWHGQVIAESDKTIDVGGYKYFPRESVRMDLLVAAPKNDSDKVCPHGVQFYDVAGPTGRSERAAWSYEKPTGDMKRVDHWLGFWDEVKVE